MSEQGENIRLTGNDRDDSGGYGAAFHHWRLLAGKKYNCCSLRVCTRLSLLLLIVSFVALLIGVAALFGQEKANSRTRYIYTTADESNLLLGRSQVFDMSKVCIVERAEGPEWVLFTDNCRNILPSPRNFNFSGTINPNEIKGYYFSLVVGSTVTVHGVSNAKYLILKESDAEEATDIQTRCTSEGDPIPTTELKTGYYYFCVTGGDSPSSFEIKVLQFFSNRSIANECRDVEHNALSKYLCCQFGGLNEYNCVYLTTRNRSPQALQEPHSVTILVRYNTALKTVLVTLASVSLIMCLVVLSVCLFQKTVPIEKAN